MNLGTFGRWLLGAAAVLAAVGVLFVALHRLGIERLPGDIVWRRDDVTVYVPVGLMILLSIILTLVLNLFFRR